MKKVFFLCNIGRVDWTILRAFIIPHYLFPIYPIIVSSYVIRFSSKYFSGILSRNVTLYCIHGPLHTGA